MGKVKREVAPPQKIWTVPGSQIPKALASTVIDMLQERLKIRVIDLVMAPIGIPGTWLKRAPLENTVLSMWQRDLIESLLVMLICLRPQMSFQKNLLVVPFPLL